MRERGEWVEILTFCMRILWSSRCCLININDRKGVKLLQKRALENLERKLKALHLRQYQIFRITRRTIKEPTHIHVCVFQFIFLPVTVLCKEKKTVNPDTCFCGRKREKEKCKVAQLWRRKLGEWGTAKLPLHGGEKKKKKSWRTGVREWSEKAVKRGMV